MDPQKFVVRLLDADARVLAWAEVYARPQSNPTRSLATFVPVVQPTPFVIERDGIVDALTVHWCDLNLARMRKQPPLAVQVGQVYELAWLEPVWAVDGMRDVPMPPVTVRQSMTIGVPAGGLGVVGRA